MLSKLFISIAIAVILIKSDAFKQASFRHTKSNRRATSLADLSVLLDSSVLTHSIDAFHHTVNHAANIDLTDLHSTFNLADADATAAIPNTPAGEVSIYSKVDKTGVIGTIASYIEMAIDLSHELIQKLGVKDTYGYSIILFTILIKVVTLPLTTSQLESTTKMQKLTPLQKRIQERYVDDETTKNKMLSQLFQAANVNPLAGCFPALIQIPIFISLYRALQNLIAENKLDEPFLWIPDLNGPVYAKPPGESLDWAKSIITGNPELGWHDTLAFLTLPLILYASQSFSSKVMSPPKDPTKVLTDQEKFSNSLVGNLPFVIAFFSLNVPSGLAVYWIINNLLTTGITLIVKSQLKDEAMPTEVAQMMAEVDTPVRQTTRKKTTSSGKSELKEITKTPVMDWEEKKVKESGFGSTIDTSIEEGEVGEDEVEKEEEVEKVDTTAADEEKKRKKRAASRKGKKKA